MRKILILLFAAALLAQDSTEFEETDCYDAEECANMCESGAIEACFDESIADDPNAEKRVVKVLEKKCYSDGDAASCANAANAYFFACGKRCTNTVLEPDEKKAYELFKKSGDQKMTNTIKIYLEVTDPNSEKYAIGRPEKLKYVGEDDCVRPHNMLTSYGMSGDFSFFKSAMNAAYENCANKITINDPNFNDCETYKIIVDRLLENAQKCDVKDGGACLEFSKIFIYDNPIGIKLRTNGRNEALNNMQNRARELIDAQTNQK